MDYILLVIIIFVIGWLINEIHAYFRDLKKTISNIEKKILNQNSVDN